MAKKSGKPAFASLNPDNMMSGGLPTDFRGTVIDAAFVEWDYEGKVDEPVLAVKLTIRPADGEELEADLVQHWSAGHLDAFVPANDDGDRVDEGEYAMRVGKRAEMSNNSNYAHLMASILDSGEAAKGKPFTRKDLTGTIKDLIGLDAHWDRVPQKKRSGMVDLGEDGEDKQKKNRDILVVTEVFGYDKDFDPDEKPAKKTTKSAKSDDDDEDEDEAPAKKPTKKPAPKEEEDEDATEDTDEESEESPLDAALSKVIKKEIVKAGGTLKKGKLATLVLKAFATDKAKNKYVARSAEEEFLSDAARPWQFDEDTGVLSVEDDE